MHGASDERSVQYLQMPSKGLIHELLTKKVIKTLLSNEEILSIKSYKLKLLNKLEMHPIWGLFLRTKREYSYAKLVVAVSLLMTNYKELLLIV